MELHDLRSFYSSHELRRKGLLPDPLKQFQQWLKEAQAAQVPEPTAMLLATCTLSGLPSTRTVLLKQLDENGFVFFTNYESRKAQEIAENPHVSATFLWKELERQVNIQGTIKKTSREVSERYFAKRPRQSQLGAAASHQGTIIPSRDILEKEYHRLEELYHGQEIPCPAFWGGYIIQPKVYEFWQGRPNRLHDRFSYQWMDEQWVIERLSP